MIIKRDTKAAIMQPTFLSWSGYYNLINHVDVFIFLDDAKFVKNSWHNNNQILLNSKLHKINIPILNNQSTQNINQTCIYNKNLIWKKKLIATFIHAYSKSNYYLDIRFIIEIIENSQDTYLSTLNEKIIIEISNYLDIKTKFLNSSSLNIEGSRSQRIVNILNHFGIRYYISPIGAKKYLDDDEFDKISDINLSYQNFIPKEYNQYRSKTFVPYLSIIDVIANIGISNTKKYIL